VKAAFHRQPTAHLFSENTATLVGAKGRGMPDRRICKNISSVTQSAANFELIFGVWQRSVKTIHKLRSFEFLVCGATTQRQKNFLLTIAAWPCSLHHGA
jgi:hypothetical protein